MPDTPPPSSQQALYAPTPDAWHRAGEALDAHLADLEAALTEAQRAAVEQVRTDIGVPLTDAVRQAADAHAALGEALPADEADATALWAALRDYRDAGAERVLAPITEALATLDVGAAVEARLHAVHAGLTMRADALPESLTQPEPPDLFAPNGAEPSLRRVRKAWVRGGRRQQERTRRLGNALRRVARKPARPLYPQGQTVPLQTLAAYFVHVHLAPSQRTVQEAIQQAFARRVARLEKHLTDWTNRLLRLESQADLARPHTPLVGEGAHAAPDGLAAEARAAHADLSTFFDAWLDDTPDWDALAAEAEEALAPAVAALREDVARAGTFMLRARTMPPEAQRGVARRQERGAQYAAWHQQAAARLRLNGELLALRRAVQAHEDAFVQAAHDVAVAPALGALEAGAASLRTLHDEVVPQVSNPPGGDLSAALREWRDRALALLDTHVEQAINPDALSVALLAAVDEQIRVFQQTLDALPNDLRVHPVPSGKGDVDPATKGFVVEMNDVAGLAWRGALDERLRATALPLQAAMDEALQHREQAATIVRYNLDTAADEAAPTGEGASSTQAHELLDNGLQRAAESLMACAAELPPPLAAYGDATVKVVLAGWARFHERVQVDARAQDQLLDLRARLGEQARETGSAARKQLDRAGTTLRRYFRLGRSRASDLIQRGQSAVGVAQLQEEELFRTMDALATTNAFLDGLPLVYRRLFSFKPVADPDLLEGRAMDLGRVRRHVERWRDGLSNAIMIRGAQGSGRTSFVNVVRATALLEKHVEVVSLEERIDEAALAARLAEALGVDAPTLAALEECLIRHEGGDEPRAVIVENMEHLLLRVPGGCDLLERTLRLFSRTDTLVLWIGTVTDAAWQFLAKSKPSLPGLVMSVRMSPLGRADLEHTILHRHRRSGMPLAFEAPADLSPLARRRLARMKSDEERQAYLRADYFDRLFRHSGQNIALALFYWLRSARFDPDNPRLTVAPVKPLSFAFLQDLDLPRAFTLRAFLEHETLTLDEHQQIFHTTEDEAYLIFESLANLLLVEPSPGQASGPGPLITDTARYRLRPLVIHPVTEYLRSKRIIY